MAAKKGQSLEELVREYFHRQGFYALRGVQLKFGSDDTTDIDVWLYGRHAASARIRSVVDVKNKKSPRAYERILWVKGLQSVLKSDRAVVVTTDENTNVSTFGVRHNVSVLTKKFLDRLDKKLKLEDHLSSEELLSEIQKFQNHRQDGDWIKQIENSKSSLVSSPGFKAFNRAMGGFRFFAVRVPVRQQHREQALRGVFLCASVACVALDSALERVVFDDLDTRYRTILDGVRFGDNGDRSVQTTINDVLSLIAESMEDGRAVSENAKKSIFDKVDQIKADTVAEFFAREHNSSRLVEVGRELERFSHLRVLGSSKDLSVDARSIIGVLADFVDVSREDLLGTGGTVDGPGHNNNENGEGGSLI